MNYRLDHRAIRELAREWGITGPIEVQRARRASYWGQHEFTLWGSHRITIDNQFPCAQALAHTLAHELRHAMQAEEAGFREWLARCTHEATLDCPYKDRPLEADAEAWADAHGHVVLSRCVKGYA